MAGAGYKLFNTGDVLTAAQVNTYLMEQTVMVFADAAARTAALSGVVSEGMISYLKDTNAVEVYNGSAWVASDDPNAIQNTIVDAKGDLITATAVDTPSRIAVGNNGESLLADSSTSTGLRWNPSLNTNAVINGGMDIWQRGTSFANPNSSSSYTVDRWISLSGTGYTFSRQSSDLTGIQYCMRAGRNSGVSATNNVWMLYALETVDSYRFAGQTVTWSFYARKGANFSQASSLLTARLFWGTGTDQNPASGFTGGATVIDQNVTLTTSWQRFTFTAAIPSNSTQVGFGTFYLPSGTAGAADYYEITGVQLELGSVATPFKRAGNTLAGELAAAMRYYQRLTTPTARGVFSNNTGAFGRAGLSLAVPMRVAPSISIGGTLNIYDGVGTGTFTALTATISATAFIEIDANTTYTPSVQGRVAAVYITGSGYLELSSEL